MISPNAQARMDKLSPAVSSKFEALAKNIAKYVGRYATKRRKTTEAAYKDLGIDPIPESLLDLTLRDLSKIEQVGLGPLVDVTDRWRRNEELRAGMAFGSRTLGRGVSLDPDISEEMLQDLIEANAFWRVSERKIGGGCDFVVTFAIPRSIADKYGFKYSIEWYRGDDKWCLTDDGYVVPVHHRVARGAGFFRATSVFGIGTRYHGKTWFVTDCSPKNLVLQIPDWFKEIDYTEMYGLDDIRKIREDAFAAAFVATGSKDVAIGTSSGVSRSKHTAIASELLKNPRVVQMVEDRTRGAMEAAFQRLGIEGNPEEFVVGTLIEVTKIIMDEVRKEGAHLNPKLLAVVQSNVDTLADYLAMKSADRMVTTERTLELSEGDRLLVAREIERRKGDTGLLTESAEVVAEEAASE